MPEERPLLSPDALEKNAPRPIPPLAGFWFRLGALALDVLLLRMVLQVTYPLLHPFYLVVGTGSAIVGLVVVYAYFFLAEGPVGKGLTVGKAVVGIRTTGLGGEALSPRVAAVRALFVLLLILLLFLVVLPVLGINLGVRLPIGGRGKAGLFFVALVSGLATPYVVGNVLLVVLHPLKQTVHDLLAGALVLREAGTHNLAAFLEQVEERLHPLQRHAIPIASVAFLAMAAVNLIAVCRQVYSPEGEQSLRFVRSFDNEFRHGPFQPTFEPIQLGMLEARLARDGLTSQSWKAMLPRPTGSEAAPTSSSYAAVFLFESRAATRPGDRGTTADLAALGARATSWTLQQIGENVFPLDRPTRVHYGSLFQTLDRRRQTGAGEVFQPRYLALVFIEEVNALLYNHDRILEAKILPLTLPKGFYEDELVAVRKEAERPNAGSPVVGAQATTATTAGNRPTTGSR